MPASPTSDLTDPTHGDACLECGRGTYSMHEDSLQLEIRRLQKLAEPEVPAGTHTEVMISEENTVSDVASS